MRTSAPGIGDEGWGAAPFMGRPEAGVPSRGGGAVCAAAWFKTEAATGAMAQYLATEGVAVRLCRHGHEVYDLLYEGECSVAVIDMAAARASQMLDLVARVRSAPIVHVAQAGLVALSSGPMNARIALLDGGVDACQGVPLHLAELAALVRALARRMEWAARGPELPVRAPARAVWRLSGDGWMLSAPAGTILRLTQAERALMLAIATDPTRTYHHRRGSSPGEPHRVAMLVGRLRRKAEDAGLYLPLHAVRGEGYAFGEHIVSTTRVDLLGNA